MLGTALFKANKNHKLIRSDKDISSLFYTVNQRKKSEHKKGTREEKKKIQR